MKYQNVCYSNELFKNLIEEVHRAQSLLADALKDIPSEYEIIKKRLEINLVYFQFIESLEMQNSKQSSILTEKFSDLLNIFSDLFDTCAPIIFSFGLSPDTLNKLQTIRFHSNKIHLLSK